MSKRQLKNPKLQVQGEDLIIWSQDRFDAGTYLDIPASDIPNNSIAQLVNAYSYPQWIEGRRGSKLYSSTALPTISTGYTASKSGTIITRTSGNKFGAADIGRYFVWDDGVNDQIIALIDEDNVAVAISETKSSQRGSIRGAVYGLSFHEETKKIVLHIDTRIFISDRAVSSWTEAIGLSFMSLCAGKSVMWPMDKYMIVFNANGIFKVRIDVSSPYYYQINSQVPTKLMDGSASTVTGDFVRRHTYTMSRLLNITSGGDRTTLEGEDGSPVVIEQESGSTKLNEDNIDYGETLNPLKFGTSVENMGKLTGGYIDSGMDTPCRS